MGQKIIPQKKRPYASKGASHLYTQQKEMTDAVVGLHSRVLDYKNGKLKKLVIHKAYLEEGNLLFKGRVENYE